jgi:hypothetical protein
MKQEQTLSITFASSVEPREMLEILKIFKDHVREGSIWIARSGDLDIQPGQTIFSLKARSNLRAPAFEKLGDILEASAFQACHAVISHAGAGDKKWSDFSFTIV